MFSYPYNMQQIQQLESPKPGVSCFFVNKVEDLSQVSIIPNTYFIGINEQAKEIYVKMINLDGILVTNTYKLASNTEESDVLSKLLNKVELIEKRLEAKENTNESISNDDASLDRGLHQTSAVP